MAPTMPRIFPGVVRERTRRGSLITGNSSEKDVATGGNLNFQGWEQDGTSLSQAVIEESGGREDIETGR